MVDMEEDMVDIHMEDMEVMEVMEDTMEVMEVIKVMVDIHMEVDLVLHWVH